MAGSQGNDVQINGGGAVDGGTYRNVTVNGVGTVRGDIACDVLRVNGAATVNANVRANTIEVNGTARIDGVVEAFTLTVNGEATLAKGAGVTTVLSKGRLSVFGDLNVRSFESHGSVAVTGTLTGEDVVAEGVYSGDRISATTVDLGLHGSSKVREIDARKVSVHAGTGWAGLNILSVFGERRLMAQSIAANVVSIDLTTVDTVRAGNAVIGAGTRIGSLAYTGELQRAEGATIGSVEKIAL